MVTAQHKIPSPVLSEKRRETKQNVVSGAIGAPLCLVHARSASALCSPSGLVGGTDPRSGSRALAHPMSVRICSASNLRDTGPFFWQRLRPIVSFSVLAAMQVANFRACRKRLLEAGAR